MSPLEGVGGNKVPPRGRLSPAEVLYAEFSKDFRLLKSSEERMFRTLGRLSPKDDGD